MKTTVYWIEGPWLGRLAIVPRPRGGDWLEEEIRSWKEAGLDVVVSLLTQDENTELELNQEEFLCRAQGIQFYAYPIQDRVPPASRKATTDLVQKLEKVLESGKSVAVHCRQGIGRSSLITALLLVSEGIDSAFALARISQERGRTVPDTIEQSNWIKSLEDSIMEGKEAQLSFIQEKLITIRQALEDVHHAIILQTYIQAGMQDQEIQEYIAQKAKEIVAVRKSGH